MLSYYPNYGPPVYDFIFINLATKILKAPPAPVAEGNPSAYSGGTFLGQMVRTTKVFVEHFKALQTEA